MKVLYVNIYELTSDTHDKYLLEDATNYEQRIHDIYRYNHS